MTRTTCMKVLVPDNPCFNTLCVVWCRRRTKTYLARIKTMQARPKAMQVKLRRTYANIKDP